MHCDVIWPGKVWRGRKTACKIGERDQRVKISLDPKVLLYFRKDVRLGGKSRLPRVRVFELVPCLETHTDKLAALF